MPLITEPRELAAALVPLHGNNCCLCQMFPGEFYPNVNQESDSKEQLEILNCMMWSSMKGCRFTPCSRFFLCHTDKRFERGGICTVEGLTFSQTAEDIIFTKIKMNAKKRLNVISQQGIPSSQESPPLESAVYRIQTAGQDFFLVWPDLHFFSTRFFPRVLRVMLWILLGLP